ncbi:MAG TPA: SRPBCC family protein [Polyangiaceae bacterium]|nr:SRPBCC family protein [Polyangiaceae bacterium]
MPTFEDVIDVRAAPEALFRLTQDYPARLSWDPFLKSAELVGAAEPAVGVRAYCVARGGLGMETEYVSYAPPRVTAVKMTRGPWVLDSFSGSWRFDPAEGGGGTRVAFRYHVRTRPAWLRFLLEPLVSAVFRAEMRKRLAALKHAAEAG